MEHCEVCHPPEIYKSLDIKEYTYWKIGLHGNQYYLGRAVILHKQHIEDFFDSTPEELDEFSRITKHFRDSLRELFHVSLFNYSTLGNVVRHVHVHVIPRYEKPVTFAGVTFTDENWGKNLAPYPKDFTVPGKILLQIKETIMNVL